MMLKVAINFVTAGQWDVVNFVQNRKKPSVMAKPIMEEQESLFPVQDNQHRRQSWKKTHSKGRTVTIRTPGDQAAELMFEPEERPRRNGDGQEVPRGVTYKWLRLQDGLGRCGWDGLAVGAGGVVQGRYSVGPPRGLQGARRERPEGTVILG